jgi:hypothetical protein
MTTHTGTYLSSSRPLQWSAVSQQQRKHVAVWSWEACSLCVPSDPHPPSFQPRRDHGWSHNSFTQASTTHLIPDVLDHLLSGNKRFVRSTAEKHPNAFADLAKGQAPEVLWIGCADSSVPETTVCHCKPGDIFVHRNIANTVHGNDFNAASVVEYAVTHLKVDRVIVCGHTKCGGAVAALGDVDLGETLNTWLHPVRE